MKMHSEGFEQRAVTNLKLLHSYLQLEPQVKLLPRAFEII